MMRSQRTISSIYCFALLRKGKPRFYLKQMKEPGRWQLTSDYNKAFHFDFSTDAETAIKEYCTMYGASDYEFVVLKVTEEMTVNGRA